MSEIVLNNRTAWRFWTDAPSPRAQLLLQNAHPSDRTILPKNPPVCELFDALRTAGLVRPGEPVHYLVSNQAPRAGQRNAVRHSSSLALPRGSLVRIAEGIYVLSPEALCAEATRGLGWATCARLANRLASAYAIEPDSKALLECTPRTSVAAIESYLHRLARGERNPALRALAWAVDGCASPMESHVELLACLPQRFGGWGLPIPQMNYPVALSAQSRATLGCATCRIDLAWPNAQVGLEYNSRSFHDEQRAWEHDAHRQNVLEAQGFRIVPLTWPQLAGPLEFEAVVRHLARLIGHRVQVRNDSARRAAECALRDELFGERGEGIRGDGTTGLAYDSARKTPR